jgi:acetolactate synthase-1/2/3 large subunit
VTIVTDSPDTVFGIPGGTILPAYDPLMDSTKIRHILVRHEQGAGHAARGTPPPPVASVSAWPPAAPVRPTWSPLWPTRTWTPCRWSRSPARCASASIGTDAFQEADIRGITMPITKHNFLVTDPRDIPRTIAEASTSPPRADPGRCSSTSPRTALVGATTFEWPSEDRPAGLPSDHQAARQADPRGRPADPRRQAPVLYVGGGVIRAGASRTSCSRPSSPASRSSRR